MNIKLMLVWRTTPGRHFHILEKFDETSEVAAHNSAVYAASVGENYVLAETPIQEPSAKYQLAIGQENEVGSVRLTDLVGRRLKEEGRSHD